MQDSASKQLILFLSFPPCVSLFLASISSSQRDQWRLLSMLSCVSHLLHFSACLLSFPYLLYNLCAHLCESLPGKHLPLSARLAGAGERPLQNGASSSSPPALQAACSLVRESPVGNSSCLPPPLPLFGERPEEDGESKQLCPFLLCNLFAH